METKEPEIQCIIYTIKNTNNGKIFVGVTTNFKKYEGNIIKWTTELEFEQHTKNLKRKTKDNLYPLLYRAMKEESAENFEAETILLCDSAEADIEYNKYISKFKSSDEKHGYNIGEIQGIIYMITNRINGRIYIGQTKTFKKIKGYIKEWTAEDRFEQHKKFSSMPSKCNSSPKLYEDMRKQGIENFKVETVCVCTLDKTGYYENYYISKFNCKEENVGYNIASGCNVDHSITHAKRKVVMTDERRANLSKTNNKHPNITELKDKDTNTVIGYRVRIVVDSVSTEKRFSSQKFTVEENFKKAQDFLEKLKKGEDVSDIRSNNKSNDCPVNIFPKNKKGVHIGYEVNIVIGEKKHTKSFCSLKITMEEKLKMAIEYKKTLLK